MSQTRTMLCEITITDSEITVSSIFQTQRLVDTVATGGSEDTNFATVMNAHKAACKSAAPAQTSPPITAAVNGRWTASAASSSTTTVTGLTATLSVPGGTGTIVFDIDQNDGTNFQYSLNGGSMTTKTNGQTLSVSNGDTIKLQCTALPAGGVCVGRVVDQSTSLTVDVFKFQNFGSP